jgi:hypothetical protein
MALSDRVRRLQKLARGDMVAIPLPGGTVEYFHGYEAQDAFSNMMERMRAPEGERPPEHPLLKAARNSTDPKWAETVYSSDESLLAAEDMSEPRGDETPPRPSRRSFY